MNGSSNIHAEAGGMLRIAAHRMIAAYPFHANLLSASQFEADPAVATMGVTVQHGRLTFFYAPEFIVMCSFEELTGLLHHEVNHVLFGHLFDEPAKFPDARARVVAQEVTVNEWIREPLPGRPITLDQHPELPPEEDTATRYRRLVDGAQKGVQNAPKNGPIGPKNRPSGPKNGPSHCKNGPAGSKKSASVMPLDDHGVWVHARQNKALSTMAVSVAVHKARQQLTADQLNALPAGVRQQIDNVAAGKNAGAASDHVSDAGNSTISWRRELRRFEGRVLEIRPVFNRPPRRFPVLVGIIPAQGRRCAKPRVMAVIDTSGSMDTATLSDICLELDRLGRLSEVTVVECDAKIQAVYRCRGRIENIHGRGGTDLRPVFATEFLRKHRPDVIVYFTDGDGPAPSLRPNVPVIWCLTPDGHEPARWGHVIRLSILTRR
jgi:predicted metal-dependent peptidase